jgi:predicted AAA+ superfamily ATPase
LEAEYQQKVTPGKTLLIFDEVQSCSRALTSLKYFAEEAPELHVAAAGSLLGVALGREDYSFPVGKVVSMDLYPLDFEEFLWACGHKSLAGEIRSSFESESPLPVGLHELAVELYRRYLAVGGMPASVGAYLSGASPVELPELHHQLLAAYSADMAKYASTTEAVKIRAAFQSIPAQLAKDNHKFQYKVARRGGSAAYFGASIEWLKQAGLVLECVKTEQGTQPLAVSRDLASFKLYLLDTGLLSTMAGVRISDVLSGANHIFQGAMAENYVAQQLAARGHELYYWTSGNQAEVDFVIQSQAGVDAIEVKSGLQTRSPSLNQFVNRYAPQRAIRLSLKPFGKREAIWPVPLYAAHLL